MGAVPVVPSYSRFTPASEAASRVKRRNRREGGRAEILLRRALWKRGFRYRVHVRSLPGTPDMVFLAARVAVFCDGDFWHGRDWAVLSTRLLQRANPDYWLPKIARNRQRDGEQARLLENAGWIVVRLWESDVLKEPDVAAGVVAEVVRARSKG